MELGSLIGYMIELFLASAFFMWKQPRRKYVVLRGVAGFVIWLVICSINNLMLLYLAAGDGIVIHIYKYMFVFLGAVLVMWFCFQVKLEEALYYSCSGYALQNVAHYIYIILHTVTSQQIGESQTDLLRRAVFVVVYLVGFLLLRKRVYQGSTTIKTKNIMVVSTITLFFTVFLSELVPLGGREYLLYYCYAIFSVLLVLYLQYDLFIQGKMREEMEIVEQLLEMEQRQRKMSEETVNLINIKCHDLKYKLSQIEDHHKLDGEALHEIREAVNQYDSLVETGNETLNILLTEKKYMCENKRISFSYMLDGSLFDFMNVDDLYSLFGNALDNAIESVIQEAKPNRFIHMKTGQQGKLFCLHMENYCGHPVEFQDGLPVTSKEQERGYHGYGVKSICFLAEKYGGHVHMQLEDCVFSMDIFMPIHEVGRKR